MLCCGGSIVVVVVLSCCYLSEYLQKQTKIDKGEGEGKQWRAVGSILNEEINERGFGFGSLLLLGSLFQAAIHELIEAQRLVEEVNRQ
ncbi:hypothetical protein KY284_010423 [Solanum tuberosum]|nr:hypothetical protein KY284_010423 [Solanum tuberosum]